MAVAFATGTLTSSGVATDTQTVTVGGKTYTTQTTLTDVDGNVAIGADAETTLANLKAAINLEAGAGTKYAASMTANPAVVAISSSATTLVVKAKVPGVVGNHIPSTETQTNFAWGAATLASGTGDITTDLRTLIAEHQINASVQQKLVDMIDPQGDE